VSKEKSICTLITVNWNSGDSLCRYLDSLVEFEDVERLEVFISDNGSTDGSLDLLKKYPFVKVIKNNNNLGFGAGNNKAIEKSASDYLLFVNPDIEFCEPVIEKLVALMKKNKALGACGPFVVNSDGSFMQQCRRGFPDPLTSFFYLSGLMSLFPESRLVGKYFYTYLPIDKEVDVDALSGSFFMVRKDALIKVGIFDESYFLFVEEVDLLLRIRREGYSVRFFPKVKIMHHGGVTFENIKARELFYRYHMTKSHLILFAKERRRAGSLIAVAGYHFAFLLILIRHLLLSLAPINLKVFAELAEFIKIHYSQSSKTVKKG